MMMRLRPDLVRTSEVARAGSLGEELGETLRWVAPEGSASFSWLVGDLNSDGAVGDATLADADLGARLVSHYGGSPGGGDRGRAGVPSGPAEDGRPMSGSTKAAGRVG